MTCSTLRTSTAYWRTERQFRSVCTTRFATLRCTNNSPGRSPTISLAGTRLSEQPIHRYFGLCWSTRRLKKVGSRRVISLDQLLLFSSRCFNCTAHPPSRNTLVEHYETCGAIGRSDFRPARFTFRLAKDSSNAELCTKSVGRS